MKLIDKDALVEEIEGLKSAAETMLSGKTDLSYWKAQKFVSERLLSFLDTIEMKEVDLEKEVNNWRHGHFHGRRDKEADGEYLERVSQLDLAKHFFELGLLSTITEEDCKLIWNIGDEIPYMPEEDFYKELLRRYKAQKGEIT